MQITGFFTIEEIQTAQKLGANCSHVSGGQQSINFKDRETYAKWMQTQKNKSPNRWSKTVTISHA